MDYEKLIPAESNQREDSLVQPDDLGWLFYTSGTTGLPGQSVTEEELIAFCKDNMASYKKPRSVDSVEELPKNNYGKILKRELRAKYWEGRERKV